MAKLKTDPAKLYRPMEPFAIGDLVIRFDTRLRGDHPAVAEHPDLWIEADAGDDEFERRRNQTRAAVEDMVREQRAVQRAETPPPPPSTVMIAIRDHDATGRSWQRGDRLLASHPTVLDNPDCWRPLDEVIPPEPVA
jgi:hypothetical protein